MAPTVTLSEKDARRLRTMHAEVSACLAMNRAMLQTLAALSPRLGAVAETTLESAAEDAASDRVAEILDDARATLSQPPAEARLARALERALVEAAETLVAEPVRRAG